MLLKWLIIFNIIMPIFHSTTFKKYKTFEYDFFYWVFHPALRI